MIEVESAGPWPENSFKDIPAMETILRKHLLEKASDFSDEAGIHFLRTPSDFVLYLPPVVSKCLDYQLVGTDITYRTFVRNNWVEEIIERGQHEDRFAVMQLGTEAVIIKNIVVDNNRPCAFCDNTFYLHREAVKLKDGRLICDECYAKVFDTVLQGLQGRTIE